MGATGPAACPSVEDLAEEAAAAALSMSLLRAGLARAGATQIGTLGADQPLQLATVEEDAVTGRALVDRDSVALVGAHYPTALHAAQLRGLVAHLDLLCSGSLGRLL